MKSPALFLRWLILACIVGIGCFFLHGAGGFDYLAEKDVSTLSFWIMGLFVVSSLGCGIQTWKASFLVDERHGYVISPAAVASIKSKCNTGMVSAWICQIVGFCGTIWGILRMLSVFDGLDVASAEQTKTIAAEFGAGGGIAFLTTLVGLMCSALIVMQYHNLKNTIDRATKVHKARGC